MAEVSRRINVDSQGLCRLHLRDSAHPVTVKNISLSGVLVQFNTQPMGFTVGGNCQVSLNGDNQFYYNCEVIWVDKHNVGLKFIDMITPSAVEN